MIFKGISIGNLFFVVKSNVLISGHRTRMISFSLVLNISENIIESDSFTSWNFSGISPDKCSFEIENVTFLFESNKSSSLNK